MQENFNPPGYGQDADTAPRLIVDLNSLLNAALLGGREIATATATVHARRVTTIEMIGGR